MSNVYGPRQSPKGEAGVIAIFCGAAARDEPARMFGDGRQTRDFIYVGDVVDAFLAAGDAAVEGALNVATGRETSLLELAAALRLEARTGPARLGEVRRSCLDPAKAARELGWHARTPLAAGLEQTLAALASLPA
jgi:UDP-glucose 4-epimerase